VKVKGQRAKVKGTKGTGVLLLLAIVLSACATRTAPPLPTTLRYPEFVYPASPQDLVGMLGSDGIGTGWRYLQNDNLREADRAFADALRRNPALYPARTGTAYVALARRDYAGAEAQFGQVLMRAPMYVPALVGQGQALLGLMRDEQALTAFDTALRVDPSLADVRRRADVLRFRNVQALIESGRAAAARGALDEAKATFERAVAASPNSALVYRELGSVERRQGNAAAALMHFRMATMLDPADTASLVQTGELLEAQMDFAGAEAAFRAANELEPSATLAARLTAIAARARDSRLPAEFQAIPTATGITRADLAALIGVRLGDLVRTIPGREEVLTDIQGHWAAQWITEIARAGVLEEFDNHTFQPQAPLRRVDLAKAVSRVVTQLATTRPQLRARLAMPPAIADVKMSHMNYPQIAAAVASGVLPLLDGNRFDVTRMVSGAEAVDAVTRLRALAATR
jgi:tetratricopeptide (TPR) repeat protein